MATDARERQVVTRIGFAERWLHQAREHYDGGDATRGLLDVVLADAEMHYALETGGMRVRGTPPRLWILALVLIGALGAALAFAADSLLPPSTASAFGAGPTTPIVRLTSPVGTWLDLVQAAPEVVLLPSPVTMHPSGQPRRAALSHPMSVRATALEPLRSTPSVGLGNMPTAESPPAPVVVLTPPAVALSAADLIDLAIAADHTLRKAPTPP